MGLLQYTSDEMYSSTELVRKSKNIFDKLNKKEIEKAIILRDGKPGIILLDFNEYEKIIKDYLELKNKIKSSPKQEKENQENLNISKSEKEEDFENALQEIEKLDFNFDTQLKNDLKEKEEPLKEFWD
ncbi:hypothetical protein [Arcobacter cloacae]|uniref:Uncharacterized protein n=1 Tax=Arcobacter cloacae TaxID=1054034 RepID=A0A6M8NBP8_9BACT|nr:hypothetical protein [Arcobacter cloacae]QKF88595.1 hypothetical protein ACLO_0047 [Arcobacter cloacae]RXI41268.1 hypothetical protein CP963_07680 [Arcobacter cloacae]